MIKIFIDDKYKDSISINDKCFNDLIKKICSQNSNCNYSINYILSNDFKLNDLKKKYFNENVFTDVIAFNLEEPGQSIDGEVYVSIDRVKENAIKFHQNFKSELLRVIIHGTLHLLGYDDKNEKEKLRMTALENKYIKNNINVIK
tara:strand:+ start:1303 stop:1737 length:435 start_codon:yes stop_codon:yes gene_type:complete